MNHQMLLIVTLANALVCGLNVASTFTAWLFWRSIRRVLRDLSER